MRQNKSSATKQCPERETNMASWKMDLLNKHVILKKGLSSHVGLPSDCMWVKESGSRTWSLKMAPGRRTFFWNAQFTSFMSLHFRWTSPTKIKKWNPKVTPLNPSSNSSSNPSFLGFHVAQFQGEDPACPGSEAPFCFNHQPTKKYIETRDTSKCWLEYVQSDPTKRGAPENQLSVRGL